MVMVLCVMAVFMALSFSILLTASVAYATSQSSLDAEKCKAMAISFSDILSQELTSNVETENNFQEQVHQGMSNQTWSYYREDEAFHDNKSAVSRKYTIDGVPNGYTMEVSMYWSPQEATVINYSKEETFTGSELFLTVSCSRGNQTYQAKSDFILKMDPTETPIIWRWSQEWRK